MPRRFAALPALLLLLLAACAPLPPAAPGVGRVASPNHDARRPNFVILHHTSDANVDDALRTLTDPERKVSAHYLIGRDGHVLQLVDEERRAWHAGASYWGGQTDLNSASIGIELDNDGEEPFAAAQIDALIVLLGEIVARHGIPPANVLGHGDVAPRRKADPSRHFPWARLAAAGFGLWCEPGPADDGPLPDPELGLRAFGYDPADPAAAALAFKRHFAADDSSPLMTPEQLARLRCLLELQRRGRE